MKVAEFLENHPNVELVKYPFLKSHPSYEIKKIYEVKLDKVLTKADFDKIISGLILEDGPVNVDSLAYADSKDKSIIGIEIHSGRNRIVRRILRIRTCRHT